MKMGKKKKKKRFKLKINFGALKSKSRIHSKFVRK